MGNSPKTAFEMKIISYSTCAGENTFAEMLCFHTVISLVLENFTFAERTIYKLASNTNIFQQTYLTYCTVHEGF